MSDVIALAASRMCVFEPTALDAIVRQFPGVGATLLRALAVRLHSAERMLAARTLAPLDREPGAAHRTVETMPGQAGQRVAAAVEEPDRFPAARETIARFCYAELLPHLEADEHWLLEARHCTEGRLIAEAIRAEARAMTAVVHELAAATQACRAVAAIRVLHALLAAHAHHEQLLLAPGG